MILIASQPAWIYYNEEALIVLIMNSSNLWLTVNLCREGKVGPWFRSCCSEYTTLLLPPPPLILTRRRNVCYELI